MSNNLKQEMIDLGNEFTKFWQVFSQTIDKISADDTEKLVSAWHEYFEQNNEPILKLIEVKRKIEKFTGIE